jgi:2-hydroxychromene-2-carboxylate isomerase
MAMEGKGPPYSRIGKKAIYKVMEVERWIERHRINTTVDMPHRKGRPRKLRVVE